MNTNEKSRYFCSRTNVIHRVMDGSYNAIPCNSRGFGIKGQPVMLTDERLAASKRCNKCFTVVEVAA